MTAQPAGQSCTVGSGSGTVSADVTSVSVSCVSSLYTVGGTVTGLKAGTAITLQDNGADTLTVSANGSFTFATSLAYNTTYTVTATTQPTAQGLTCVVTNGFSVVTGNVTTVTVTCGPANQYAYVVNFGTINSSQGTVAQFLVGSDGTLTALSTPSVNTGNNPTAIAVTPNYSYVYVTNYADGTVSQYSITPGGSLKALASVPGTIPYFNGTVPTGSTMMPGPSAIAVNPNGKYVYVLNATEATITEFTIGAMGELSPLTTTLAASTLPTSTQLAPATLSTPAATITPGTQPPVLAGQIAVDPAGRFLFVTSPISNTVTQYSIDATTGALTVSPAAPLTTGATPIGIAINPKGTFAYVANSGASPGDLSQFSLSSTGLAPLAAPTVMTDGVNPSFVAIDPSGKYLYESDNHGGAPGTISQYTIGATGELTLLTVNSVDSGASETDASPQSITVDLTGQYAYVTNTFSGTLGPNTFNASVGQFMITPANSIVTGAIPGALVALAAGPVTTNVSIPTAIAVAYGQ